MTHENVLRIPPRASCSKAHGGGSRSTPSDIANELAEQVGEEALSDRELDVRRRVAEGNSNRRVAMQLSISEETVKAHTKNILSKVGADDRTHTVTIALRRGIIDIGVRQDQSIR
jgi:two-component system NarL family response regulator